MPLISSSRRCRTSVRAERDAHLLLSVCTECSDGLYEARCTFKRIVRKFKPSNNVNNLLLSLPARWRSWSKRPWYACFLLIRCCIPGHEAEQTDLEPFNPGTEETQTVIHDTRDPVGTRDDRAAALKQDVSLFLHSLQTFPEQPLPFALATYRDFLVLVVQWRYGGSHAT